jgi:hypothetical protein
MTRSVGLLLDDDLLGIAAGVGTRVAEMVLQCSRL